MKLNLLSVVVPLTLMSAHIDAAPVEPSTPNTPQTALPGTAPSGNTGGGPPKTRVPAKQPNCPGMGVMLKNSRKEKDTYYFYNNLWNGDGKAGPNFEFNKPDMTVALGAGEEKYVPLDAKFKGRIQRGKELGGTWAEFQTQADNDKRAHGDISLQQGCDGPATIGSTCTEGNPCDPLKNVIGGFDWDPFKGANKEMYWPKENGRKLLDTTEGNWERKTNQETIKHLQDAVGQDNAYIVGGTGTRDIASDNNCLSVIFY